MRDRNNNNNGCFVVVAVPLIEGATVCLFLALKSGIADNICLGSLSKKDSLGTADVCQYLFELSELKIAPSSGRKIQLQILASKPNSYIALLQCYIFIVFLSREYIYRELVNLQ